MPTSSDKNISTPIFNVLTRDIYNSLTTVDPDQFYLITDDTGITPGSGLTATTAGGETIIGHSNSISAITTQSVYPITIDTEGHISSVGSAIDLSNIGGGSGGGGFILTRYADGSFDKTAAELNQAWVEGQTLFLRHSFSDGTSNMYVLTSHAYNGNTHTYMFQSVNENQWAKMIITADATTISLNDFYYNSSANFQHSHGIITYSGYAGTNSNKALYTVTNGVIAAGTLPVTAGGTGLTTVTSGSVLIGNGTSALTTRAITNNTSATTATTNSNLITGSTLYYATANINNARQTSNVGIYAPTSGGTAGQILTASGTTSAPVWANTGSITVGAAVKDGDGNTIATTYVRLAGDTMTGNLLINASGGRVTAQDSSSTGSIFMGFGTTHQAHGLWSFGYAPSATTWTDSGIWLIDREADGIVRYASGRIRGQITGDGKSQSWYNGREGALLRMDTISLYSPILSTKTTSGSWELGTYDNSGFYNDLIFTYIPDTSYSSSSNTPRWTYRINADGATGFFMRNISYGTAAPSGGSNGDIYIQYS